MGMDIYVPTMWALGVMVLCLTAYRFLVIGRQGKGHAGYETGTCATIGSREIQEDAYGTVEGEGGIMAVLADGMGSGYGGRIASRTAVEVFVDMFRDSNAFYNPQYYFRRAFHAANRSILERLNGERGSASVAAVMVKSRKLYYASVGNVKTAVYRNGELVPVTSGHTVSVLARQKYIEGKLTRQAAVSLLEQHRTYNYVGQDGFRDIEFFDVPVTLYGGEYVVLLSDGMYEGVSWREIEECLAKRGSCGEKALELTELVNAKISEDVDNASIVIIRVP